MAMSQWWAGSRSQATAGFSLADQPAASMPAISASASSRLSRMAGWSSTRNTFRANCLPRRRARRCGPLCPQARRRGAHAGRGWRASAHLHLDAPRAGLFRLGNRQAQHAVAQLRLDARGIELAAQGELPAEGRTLQLAVDQLHVLRAGRRGRRLQHQVVAVHPHVELVARDAREVGEQGDGLFVLEHVYRRHDVALLRHLLVAGHGAVRGGRSLHGVVVHGVLLQFTSMRRGRDDSRLATLMRSTPSRYAASTRAGSASSGRLTTRRKRPVKRSLAYTLVRSPWGGRSLRRSPAMTSRPRSTVISSLSGDSPGASACTSTDCGVVPTFSTGKVAPAVERMLASAEGNTWSSSDWIRFSSANTSAEGRNMGLMLFSFRGVWAFPN